MIIQLELEKRFEAVFYQVCEEVAKSPTPACPLRIVAATKKQGVDAINAYIAWSRRKGLPVLIGENYVQEFRRKKTLLSGYDEAHLIGALQSNKIADAVQLFDVIQSVHSIEVLQSICAQCVRQRRRLAIFLQVNISGDVAKAGFDPTQVATALPIARACPWVSLQGLMTITRFYERAEEVRPDFQRMRTLRSDLDWPEANLSMGMSSDFAVAIQEGATHVRIGTALFGERA